MKRTDFGAMPCPIARSLDRVGEWWNILILREAFYGVTHFDEFQKNLGIAPNILTRRLKDLVSEGLLETRLYSQRPPRHEYLLTNVGRDFGPVILALIGWGNTHFSPDGHSIDVTDTRTGKVADLVLTDRNSGSRIDSSYRVVPGPAASNGLVERLNRSKNLFETHPNGALQ